MGYLKIEVNYSDIVRAIEEMRPTEQKRLLDEMFSNYSIRDYFETMLNVSALQERIKELENEVAELESGND